MRDLNQPQSVGISQLMSASPLPVSIPPHIQSLVTLISMVESSEMLIEMYKRNPTDEEGCPPMREYSLEWDTVNERILELVKEVNDLATKYTTEIDQLVANFEFSRTRHIAACPKDDCADREGAQERLGWQDGEEIRQ